MLVQRVPLVALIIFKVYAVDWKAVQIHGPLPEIFQNNCITGKYYRYRCNVCECVPPGTPKCGTLRCIDDSDSGERSGDVTKDGCAVGTVYRDWCNLCRCETGNFGVCTRMRCRKYPKL